MRVQTSSRFLLHFLKHLIQGTKQQGESVRWADHSEYQWKDGSVQWPEQVVNAHRSTLNKTRGSHPHEVFKMYTLFLLPFLRHRSDACAMPS